MPHSFVSYLREDQSTIDQVVAELKARGVVLWIDREQIEPGERWRDAIRRAIEHGGFFIACFSATYRTKKKTHMNEELALAIAELRQRSSDVAWFIPVVIDGGEVPDRSIGEGQTLRDLQWVDLRTDWDGGIARLARSLGAIEPTRPDLHDYHANYEIRDFDGRIARVRRVIQFGALNLGAGPLAYRPAAHYELHEKDMVASSVLRIHEREAGGWRLVHEEVGTLVEDRIRKTCKLESSLELTLPPGTLLSEARYRVEFLDELMMKARDRDILASYSTVRDLRFTCHAAAPGAFEFSVGDSPRLIEVRRGEEWSLDQLAPRETIAVRWAPCAASLAHVPRAVATVRTSDVR